MLVSSIIRKERPSQSIVSITSIFNALPFGHLPALFQATFSFLTPAMIVGASLSSQATRQNPLLVKSARIAVYFLVPELGSAWACGIIFILHHIITNNSFRSGSNQ